MILAGLEEETVQMLVGVAGRVSCVMVWDTMSAVLLHFGVAPPALRNIELVGASSRLG